MQKLFIAAALAAVAAANAHAQVTVNDPWVRGTVARQTATGAFMQLLSREDGRLVGASTPLADRVEIHEMKLENDVMRMRPVEQLMLSAGSPVELKPGGYHLMLMGLKKPLQEGEELPLTLEFQGARTQRQTLELRVPVRGLGAPGSPHAPVQGGHR